MATYRKHPVKKTQPKKYRGPSRPIDPRNAPGMPSRQGPDRFGYALIAIGMAFVLIMVLFASIFQGGGATTATPASQAANPPPPGNSQAPSAATSAAQTQVAVAFATRTVSLPTISPADAKALYDAKSAAFIDVRDPNGYAAEHIPGATNILYTDAQKRIAEFPKTGNLIVYCQ